MKRIYCVLAAALVADIAFADTTGFDDDAVGAAPAGWNCGVTSRGAPRWAVNVDTTAPSKPNVLMQSGHGTFPWCVKNGVSLADGFVEVKFKPMEGREDRAGGV